MNCLLQAEGRETRALPKSFTHVAKRQQVEPVTSVQRERNVERPLPPVVTFLPPGVYPKFAIPSFGPRATGSLPSDSRPSSQSAGASGQQPADRRIIASAPPVRST